ncbi:MAG: hypothetical protein LBF95_00930 [Treponema sp.]|jgi:hypothetical protein|nr:hypothetical protein [Treponema sp.]
MTNTGETAETAEGLSYEKVWAMFREIAERQAETGKQIRELSKEADRRQAETALQMRETDRKMQETDRIVKELSKNIGGLHNAFGKWTEELVSAKLWEKFNEMGYKFTHGGPRKFWEGSRTVAQVDMLLENGEYAMPVEIKAELSIGDVDVHITRIERVREQLDKRGDRRKLVGAIAGMVVGEAARKYAQEKGLYVLEQSGDMVEVAEAPEGFKAREW